MNTSQTGKTGEDAACLFLESKGHRILERNWRYSHKEIDIITLYADELHIVEVKSRRQPSAVDPVMNITPAKMRNVASAARAYLHTGPALPSGFEVFFDVVTVLVGEQENIISYYPKAYIPLYV